MNFPGFISAWLLFLVSTSWLGHSLLRKNCGVLEKKYYAQFIDLQFDLKFECQELMAIDFLLAAVCDSVKDLPTALKEVPLETDWLCLTHLQGVKIEAGVFSQFSNLKSLYILGDVNLLPGAFSGLTQLRTLWIRSLNHNTTLYEDTFKGLDSLQELKISRILLSTFSLSILSQLYLLEHLILENNNITYLSEVTTSMDKFHNLQKLSVIQNEIRLLRNADCLTVPYGESMRFVDFNISYLDLSANYFIGFQNNSLCNFPHLKVFKAEGNYIVTEDILVSGMRTIKYLELSYNNFDEFQVCKFTSQYQAEEVQLSSCSISNISTENGSCEHLKKLDLSSNTLRQVQVEQIYKLSHLLELDLSKNNINDLSICANETVPVMKLVYLNISYNYLTELQEEQFVCLKELQILSLEQNKIVHIAQSAFHGLDQLQVLNLQYNNVFVIQSSTFSNLFLLRHLNLYGNVLQECDPQAFWKLSVLQDIGLTYQELSDLFPWIYMPRSVRHISVKASILQKLGEFVDEFPFLERLEIDSPCIILNCTEFHQATELHLKYFWFLKCETEESLFLIFSNVKKLYYTGNSETVDDNTHSNMLKYYLSLKFLYLQDTDLMVKHGQLNAHEMFQGLSQLKVLHLKNSGIEHWDSNDITRDLKELEFLFIEDQSIEEVSVTIFDSMANLKYIYFFKTTFPCSCKFSELLSWLESGTSVSIINFHQQKCQLYQNATNLISFLRSSCQTKLDLIMFLVTLHFVLLFLCISLFYESICWYLLYIVYTIKCWLKHNPQAMDQYNYDVFVSYNSQDEPWVLQELFPNLEQNGPPYFKVCIHNRDFEIGRDIVDNIMDSIYNSRWTVCIITRNYLQSSWCSLEMRVASYRLLSESKDSLIVIFLEKISREELQHYHRLTKLMDKKTYVDWPENENGQQLFWARLRNVIANSGRKIN
ncbi:uncharacterized protein PAF06_012675 [Gastrophryne carolinensis]